MKITFIGLGNMGGGMAANQRLAPQLEGDRPPALLQQLIEEGAAHVAVDGAKLRYGECLMCHNCFPKHWVVSQRPGRNSYEFIFFSR